MKKIVIIIFSVIFLNGLMAQECKNTFENYFLGLSICNDSNWNIKYSAPYIIIKTPDVETFITIFSEAYEGNETLKELVDNSFKSDKELYPTIEKIKEENLLLDSIMGTFYIAKLPEKSNQITTYKIVNNDRIYTINNNCYSNCENSEQAVKNIINNTRFQRIEEPILTEKELNDFEKFKIDLHSAFQSEKVKSFEKLQMNQLLMLEFFGNIKDETIKQKMIPVVKDNWNEISKEFLDKNKKSFNEIIKNGKKQGIKWNQIEFIDCEYMLNIGFGGITSAKCEYIFSFQKKRFKITIEGVEKLSSGWYIGEIGNSDIEEIKTIPNTH